MELNESMIISFLVIVIIILIFSKINIGSDLDESSYLDEKLDQLEKKLKSEQPTPKVQSNSGSDDLPMDESLLSDDFRKQLREMENRFYYDNCRLDKS